MPNKRGLPVAAKVAIVTACIAVVGGWGTAAINGWFSRKTGGETEVRKPVEVHTSYVASRKSDKFHLVDCKWAKEIAAENRVTFATRGDAVAAGYQPCKVCKP